MTEGLVMSDLVEHTGKGGFVVGGSATVVLTTPTLGYVALLDVLGFSERIARQGLAGLEQYIGTVAQASQRFENRLSTILFSDTIVIHTKDDAPASFESLLTLSSQLLHALTIAAIPVRGAITYGQFATYNAHGSTVLAGQPIIDAYRFENQLQWIGIMLTPSIASHIDLSERCSIIKAKELSEADGRMEAAQAALRVQLCTKIPLQREGGPITSYKHFAIVPIDSGARTHHNITDSLTRFNQKLEELKLIAPNRRSQDKYERAKRWVNEVLMNFLEADLRH